MDTPFRLDHRRSPSHLIVASSLWLLAACSSAAPPAPTVPDNAYGFASDPLPVGAVEVLPAEYDRLKALPGAQELNKLTRDAQAVAAAAQEAADDAAIKAAEVTSGLVLAPQPPTPDSTTIQDGGNLLTTVDTEAGPRTFVTMGQRWGKHQVATALRTYGTHDNQVALYSTLAGSIDAATLAAYGVLDPTLVATYPLRYTTQQVMASAKVLADNWQTVISGANLAGVVPYLPSCTIDVGKGSGGDRSENASFCTFKPGGPFANWAFPMQRDLTCVKDQGRRGTCVAFATVGGVEYQVHKKYGTSVNLSEQAYYNRIAAAWDPRLFEDGAYVSDMLTRAEGESWLFPLEDHWNYNPSLNRFHDFAPDKVTITGLHKSCDGYGEFCSDTAAQGVLNCTTVNGNRLCVTLPVDNNLDGSGYRVTTHSQIWDPTNPTVSASLMLLATVFKNPVVWSFHVTPYMEFQLNGFVTYVAGEKNRGNHATLIVGFITNQMLVDMSLVAAPGDGGGYFIVKNSWTNCWGDGGYFYVPYSFVRDYTVEASILHEVQ
jgi:Papain family cysteine protease